MSKPLPTNITLRDKYGPAMAITEQAEADEYFARCVEHTMSFGHSREKAEAINRGNLGYWAGYYDEETQVRVHRLFRCVHPFFGTTTPSTQKAFEAGIAKGEGHE